MNSSVSALPLSTLNPANEALTLRLPSSLQLKQQLPLSNALTRQVADHRQAVRAILNGEDSRLLVIVGPCSIHDPRSALEYAANLARLAAEVSDEMLLVMRAYVEKPRTTVGWKGLAYDPHLDGSDDMAGGLTLSRELMREMLQLGLPVATELLQPMAAGYFDDLLSWVAIGARTTESQIHREMASGLGMPVGFKNGTDGSVAVASDAMRSAAHPHRHFGVDSQGHPAIIQTAGQPRHPPGSAWRPSRAEL
ncbi:phospho-2-dehydro-3-deoxyheptonate aldolase [Pseudomonas sp. ADAK2 TE3594]